MAWKTMNKGMELSWFISGLFQSDLKFELISGGDRQKAVFDE